MRTITQASQAVVTVGTLARRMGLSRTALLYYDRIGLLRPTGRSAGNYRVYRPAEVERLGRICFYRRIGVPLREIGRLLERGGGKAEGVLRRRLESLEAEIEGRKEQQRQIMKLLEHFPKRAALVLRKGRGVLEGPARIPPARRPAGRFERLEQEYEMVSKEKWVAIMKAAGFSEQQRLGWHRNFEKMEPAGHQEFLESLGLSAQEVRKIREQAGR